MRQPLVFAAVLGALLGYRVVAHYLGLRAEVAPRQAGAARERFARRKKKKFWSGELMIARIFDETHDVKTFRFVDARRRPAAVRARRRSIPEPQADDRRQARQSLVHDRVVADAQRTTARSRVKRARTATPRSTSTRTGAKGERVKVCAPAGKFVFAGHEAERVVLIAGGIGITPMMAVVRSLTDRGWRGEIYLLFSVRAVRDIVFRDELALSPGAFPNLHVQRHRHRRSGDARGTARAATSPAK